MKTEPAGAMVEEGIRGVAPSSFEILFTAEHQSTCVNVTIGNIKRHF
jgi:hypothetical protein